jgi:hypothetical protein
MGDCQLDDLLDMLDDEEDEILREAEVDDPEPEQDATDDNAEDADVEMARKLHEMEEQVRLMREKMSKKPSKSQDLSSNIVISFKGQSKDPVKEIDLFSSPSSSAGMSR